MPAIERADLMCSALHLRPFLSQPPQFASTGEFKAETVEIIVGPPPLDCVLSNLLELNQRGEFNSARRAQKIDRL